MLSTNETGKVFVYGTLKVGGYFAEHFNSVRLKSSKAKIKGTLFDSGQFPAMKLDGKHVVHGELHEYSNFVEVILQMDRIEGYNGEKDREFNLYNRTKTMVETDEGNKIAVIYEFNKSTVNMPIIETGIWEI